MTTGATGCAVLFLIFRQPDVTRQVFERIRQMRPSRLYISADGPRSERPGEAEECEVTRQIVSDIEWECEIHTRFLPENLGLKKAVSSALDWFFDFEDEGIILEYDCLPDPSFFEFCHTMLARYRDDPRVFSITGNNIQADIRRGDGDYYFSRITPVWGWATWKRSWQLWRPVLEDYETFKAQSLLNSVVTIDKGREFWLNTFDSVHSGENVTTWAFCLIYAQIRQGGYCVVPNKNLIRNLGFGPHATNAMDPDHPLARLEVDAIKTYNAPSIFAPDLDADNEFSLRASYSPTISVVKRAKNYIYRRMGRLLRGLKRLAAYLNLIEYK